MFLESQERLYAAGGAADASQRALVDFCQALLCLNEFVSID
jgi:hypothetical protein